MGKVFSTKVYLVQGANRPFYHLRDARGFCEDNRIDTKLIESFDSIGEYKRWLYLLTEQRKGNISDLKRQVTFEIIPPKYEHVVARQKVVKHYYARFENGYKSPQFEHKTDLSRWARRNGYDKKEYTIIIVETKEPVFRKKIKSKAAHYTADFTYNRYGKYVVEDVKSEFTRKEKDYVLRKKLMLHVHDIEIYEHIT